MKSCSKVLSAALAVCLLFSSVTPALADEAAGPSSWAADRVERAIYLKMVPEELQGDYQADMTRAEFAKMTIYFLAAQHDYPTFWAGGVADDVTTKDFVCYFLENRQRSGQPRYSKEDFWGDVPEARRTEARDSGWRELLTLMAPFSESGDLGDDSFYIHAAYVLGIVNGRDDGTFGPDDPITRQEAAAMLDRVYRTYANKPLDTAELTQYQDEAEIGAWAKDPVARMVQYEIMTGTEEDRFSPLSPYTREQCIVTFDRLYRNAPVSRPQQNVPFLSDMEKKLATVYHKNVDVWDRWDTDDAVVITGRSGMAPIAAFHGTQLSPMLYILYRSDQRADICLPDDAGYSSMSNFSLSEDRQYVHYIARFDQEAYKPYRIHIQTGEIEALE